MYNYKMRILNGAELRDFIKERQAKQVRALRQSWKVFPKLVIFYTSDNPVIKTYIGLKKAYGEDILIDIEARFCKKSELKQQIQKANLDENVHGIIVQLPIEDDEGKKTEGAELLDILSEISSEKDVDGLAGDNFDPATAVAINWLLAGYNIDLSKRKIAIVGQGLLVGKPLAKMWHKSGYDIVTYDKSSSSDMVDNLSQFDVVVSAAGIPELIKSSMLKHKAVVVDAGTAEQGGVIRGDVSDKVRETRKDLTVTPKIGGVGPLTVAALIDNVITSARRVADKKGQQDL